MDGPEKGQFGGQITTKKFFLGAGTSAWSAAICRASHTPLFNCNSPSNRNLEGWIICLRIPILRRMMCGGRNIPLIFLLVTDSLHLYFHVGIVHQIFHTPKYLEHLLMVLNHLEKYSPVSLTVYTVSSKRLVAATIVLPCSSINPKHESKFKLLAMLLLCNT